MSQHITSVRGGGKVHAAASNGLPACQPNGRVARSRATSSVNFTRTDRPVDCQRCLNPPAPLPVKVIRSVSRHGTSVNGNPQYRVVFTDGTEALTSSDSAFAYEIQNGEFRGVPVELTLTRAGRIAYARVVK